MRLSSGSFSCLTSHSLRSQVLLNSNSFQNSGVLGVVARDEGGHERAARAHPQVLGAGESQPGAGQRVGLALATPGLGYEGVDEIHEARRGQLVGQLGGRLMGFASGKQLAGSIMLNIHELGQVQSGRNTLIPYGPALKKTPSGSVFSNANRRSVVREASGPASARGHFTRFPFLP